MIIAAIFFVSTASAAVLSGYFDHTTHATVDEAIRIDGAESWPSLYGGESSEDEIVITDNNSIPVNVVIDEFQEGISNTYFQASNKYFVEYDKLISNRSVEGIIET